MRIFYLTYPIRDALRHELTWTHYRLLLKIQNKDARQWYEQEALRESWAVRILQRNISSQYYYRLLKSQSKEKVAKEMKTLTDPYQRKLEFVKNPMVTEFFVLSSKADYTESELEKKHHF